MARGGKAAARDDRHKAQRAEERARKKRQRSEEPGVSPPLRERLQFNVYLNLSFRLDAYKCILSDPSYNIKSQQVRSTESAKRTSCEATRGCKATSLRSRQGARSAASSTQPVQAVDCVAWYFSGSVCCAGQLREFRISILCGP